jgi:hypothetical protein
MARTTIQRTSRFGHVTPHLSHARRRLGLAPWDELVDDEDLDDLDLVFYLGRADGSVRRRRRVSGGRMLGD